MGRLAMLSVAFIFGLFGVFITYNSTMFGDLFQVAFRNGVALLFLLPIIFWRKIQFSYSKREWLTICLYALVSVFILVAVTLAYLYAPIKTVLAVRYSVTVVCSVVMSFFLFREPIRRVNIIALILALIGISIFAYPFEGFVSSGVLFSLIAAIGFLVVGAILKTVKVTPEVLMTAEFSTIAILVTGFVLLTQAPTITTYDSFSFTIMLLFSALLIAVTYLMVYGYRTVNFNLANIILTSEIAFGLLFGYLLLGQTIDQTEWIGIVLIAVAVILPHLWSLVQVRNTQPAPIRQ